MLIRNHAVSHADIEITTNSLGFRYRELEAKKATDLRLLVLGDSITFSDYTAYDDPFTEGGVPRQRTRSVPGPLSLPS